MTIRDAIIDESSGEDPQAVFAKDGLLEALKKRWRSGCSTPRWTIIWGTEAEEEAGNHRNGYSGKTVLTDTGKLELAIPRDRQGASTRC